MKKQIYLDHNATTPLDPIVAQAMIDEMGKGPRNPSSVHFFGQEAKKTLSHARSVIADFLGVKSNEIVFSGSGTESMNLLIHGLIPSTPCHIIGSSLDHPCVFETLQALEKEGYEVTYLTSDLSGAPSPKALQEALRPSTKLIVLSAVNSETGVKLDMEAAAAIAKQATVPLILDGVALLGKERFSIPDGITGMGFSAHKIHGPKGVGFAFLRSGSKLRPLFYGGGQEFKHRPGTENLAGIVGLATAISLFEPNIDSWEQEMQRLRDRFEKGLFSEIPGLSINGTGPRICNISNLCFPEVDGESLLIHLDMRGIAASHASACSSGALEISRVLLNMGMPKKDAASSLRFSFSRMNIVEEVDQVIKTLSELINCCA